MKKIVLFATVIAFTATAMGQTLETRKKASTTTAAKSTKPATVKTVTEAKDVPATKAEALTTVTAATAQPSPDDVVKVNTVKYDFGKIKQGVPVNYSFELKNLTGKPVVVENSYASCGCTTPEKIVEPIAPGATAKLKVQYNAANPGPFTKDVHIKLAGITQEKVVQITGEVVATEAPKPSN